MSKIMDNIKTTSCNFLKRKDYQIGLLLFILLGLFFYLRMKENKEKERKMKVLSLAFKNLLNDLQLKPDTLTSVEKRKESIQKRISKDFWDDKKLPMVIFGGSFGRGTAIRGRSDFDLLVEVPFDQFYRFRDYSGNGQSSFLQSIRNSLLLTYPTSEVRADGQVVIVKFSDGIEFEIVPFFNNGANFIYPDTNQGGTWKVCFTLSELKAFQRNVYIYGDKLIHVCQMARTWKIKNNVPMSGILIDTLAVEFMKQWKDKFATIQNWEYPFMFGYFMFFLNYRTYGINKWQVEGGKLVLEKKGDFESKAEKTTDLLLKALNDYVYLRNFKLADTAFKDTFGTYYKCLLEGTFNGTK